MLRHYAIALLSLNIIATATHAQQVWLNPPTSQPELEPFSFAVDDVEAGDTKNASDTENEPLALLRDKVRFVESQYQRKAVSPSQRTPWEALHWVIAYGTQTEFTTNHDGKRVNGISWMCGNAPLYRGRLLYIDGRLPAAHKGPAMEGHHGQFLSVLAQSHVPSTYPIYVSKREFMVGDLVRHEQLTCRRGEELTFKLISLVHYLPTDSTWLSSDGETWSIQKLIREELSQPVLRGVACGGTHRLMGLSYAVAKRAKEGEAMIGEFQRAKRYIEDYQRYALSLQNRDGSFSTQWLQSRANRNDTDRKLQTTGHILEWLAFSLPEGQLRSQQMVASVDFLCDLLHSHPQRNWNIGPLGHALHGLAIYDQRVFPQTHTVNNLGIDTIGQLEEKHPTIAHVAQHPAGFQPSPRTDMVLSPATTN